MMLKKHARKTRKAAVALEGLGDGDGPRVANVVPSKAKNKKRMGRP